jgi:anti-sigma-K factor RskA
MSDNQQSQKLTPQDAELLSAYVDGMLSDNEVQALEKRLERDPHLRRELRSLRQTVALLNNLPPLKAPRDFTLTDTMLQNRRNQAAASASSASSSAEPAPGTASASGSVANTGGTRRSRNLSLWGGLAATLAIALVGVLLVITDGSPAGDGFSSQQIAQAPTATATEIASDESDAIGAVELANDDDTDDTDDTVQSDEALPAAPAPDVTDMPTMQAEAEEAFAPPSDEQITTVAESDLPAADSLMMLTATAQAQPPQTQMQSVEDGQRFAFTPAPVGTLPESAADSTLPPVADFDTDAADAPESRSIERDALAESADAADTMGDAPDEPSAAGGAAEAGLAVPDDTSTAIAPDISISDAEAQQILRQIFQILRLLVAFGG